jgi:hypothetical protein
MAKQFNAASACSEIAQLAKLAEIAKAQPSDSIISEDWFEATEGPLLWASAVASDSVLDLPETAALVERLNKRWLEPGAKIAYKDAYFSLTHLLELLESELDKRKIFGIESSLEQYYRNDVFGVKHPSDNSHALHMGIKAQSLFSERTEKAFPSAYMDIVEAGRCLALGRNNAAIYHLMQVAEIGLRALARDRRVTIERGKKRTIVPLDYAQWGQIIGQLGEKIELINHWKRTKSLREEALRFYRSALFEITSFNEIFRKHISHARGTLYSAETALSCWGHVHRFMGTLAERISEAGKTDLVWKTKK